MAEILLETDDAVSQQFRGSIYGETQKFPCSKRIAQPHMSFAQERRWESPLKTTLEVYKPVIHTAMPAIS